MPLFKTIPVTGGLIGVWQLTEKSRDLTPHFSSKELDNHAYKQYTYEKRQVEWLATRLLIRQMIGSDFTISYSETGKPILEHSRFKHVSISHSRYFVAVFVHEQLNIGIDIEDLTRNYIKIEKRFLSENELVAVNKNPKLQCLYWCAKEAIFKLIPNEGVEFREQILISPFNPEFEDRFSARFKSESEELIFQLYFEMFCDHGLVWVMDSR
jgi:4'-phosphopantetheinyl transferase